MADTNLSAPVAKTSKIDPKELLKAGTQFGHETKRWNPKMRKFIRGEKNNIHIIDVDKTIEKLSEASNFLREASSKGQILFVGTKRQASQIIKEEAIRSGAYYINARWAGGLLTNFKMIKESLNKLNSLEKIFEEGVQGRTKYEVSRMKKEWQKLDRLYSGIKSLTSRPSAVVVLDSNYEKAAIKECKKISIPVVGIIDTNADPESVQYPIPANDDAIKSIRLLFKELGDAILEGNKGEGVKHVLTDYSKVEVRITKEEVAGEVKEEIVTGEESEPAKESVVNQPVKKRTAKSKGILEKVKEDAEKKQVKKKAPVKKKPEAKAPAKKTVKKEAKPKKEVKAKKAKK